MSSGIPERIVELIKQDELSDVRAWAQEKGHFGRRDGNGETLLHKAAYYGAGRVARYLLDGGMSANVRDNSGYTPLHEAARAGKPEVLPLLLSYGADADALTSGEKTPQMMAEEKGDFQTIDTLRRLSRLPRWLRTGDDEIAHVSHKDRIRYKVTQIFNFSARTHILITQNEATKAETVQMKNFADFSETHLIHEAEKAFIKAGGTLPDDYGSLPLEKPAAAGLKKSAFTPRKPL